MSLAAGLGLAGWVLALPFSILTAALAAETFLGLASRKRESFPPDAQSDVAIVIPAHDEAAGIGETLDHMRAIVGPRMRLLVVADNCSDETADIARSRAGVTVIERREPDRVGKGFALAFARSHLTSAPPDRVVILDADCRTDAESLRLLAAASAALGRPVQGEYLLDADARDPLLQASNFAFFVKNSVRQKGLRNICGAVMLNGTGMAFPWPVFAQAPLASPSIVEDLELGLALIRSGSPPFFLEEARITSPAAKPQALSAQRSRWEGGYIAAARKWALPLLGEGLRRKSWSTFWAGLHLAIPPLTLFLGLDAAVTILLALLAGAGAGVAPLLLLLLAQALAWLGLLLAWIGGGRKYLPASSLPRLPLYVAWKAGLYLRLRRGAPARWIRTERS